MPHGDLQVYLEGALNIKNTAILGKCSPYCILTVGSQTFKGNVASDGGSRPYWNQTFDFKIDRSTNHLMIQIKARNSLRDHDLIGECTLAFVEVFREKHTVAVAGYPVTRAGKHYGDIRLGLTFFAKKRPANLDPSPGPLFLPARRPGPALSPIPSLDVAENSSHEGSSRRSQFGKQVEDYDGDSPRRSRHPSHDFDRPERRNSLPPEFHPPAAPLRHSQSVPTPAHAQRAPPRGEPRRPDPRAPPPREGSRHESSGHGGRPQGGAENVRPENQTKRNGGPVRNPLRQAGPVPSFAPPTRRDEAPAAATHLKTPNGVAPLVATRHAGDFSFAEIPSFADCGTPSPATLSALPQVPTVPSPEAAKYARGHPALPDPAIAANVGEPPQSSDAAKVEAPDADSKPLYVRRKSLGTASPGQSARRSERDFDAESEGSRRSSSSQDPSRLSKPRHSGELAAKAVRKGDSDTESEGSRRSRRPGASSQDRNVTRFSGPPEPESAALGNQSRGHSREREDRSQHGKPAVPGHVSGPHLGSHGSPRPLHPDTIPNGAAAGTHLHLPTARMIRAPNSLHPEMPPPPGAHNARGPHPGQRPGPGPRPLHAGLPYPPGHPQHRPVVPTQPGGWPTRGPSPAQLQPRHHQPGHAPAVDAPRSEAERAARFGRNERGEPLQEGISQCEGKPPTEYATPRAPPVGPQDSDSDTESEGSKKSRKSNASRSSAHSKASNVSSRIGGPPRPRPSSRLASQSATPQRLLSPALQPQCVPDGGESSGSDDAPTYRPRGARPQLALAPRGAPPQPASVRDRRDSSSSSSSESSDKEDDAHPAPRGAPPQPAPARPDQGDNRDSATQPAAGFAISLDIQINDDDGGDDNSQSVERTVTVERTVSVEQSVEIERSVEEETSYHQSVEVQASYEQDVEIEASHEQNLEVGASYDVGYEGEVSYEEATEEEAYYNESYEENYEAELSYENYQEGAPYEENYEAGVSYEEDYEVGVAYEESYDAEVSYEEEYQVGVSYEESYDAELSYEENVNVDENYVSYVGVNSSYEETTTVTERVTCTENATVGEQQDGQADSGSAFGLAVGFSYDDPQAPDATRSYPGTARGRNQEHPVFARGGRRAKRGSDSASSGSGSESDEPGKRGQEPGYAAAQPVRRGAGSVRPTQNAHYYGGEQPTHGSGVQLVSNWLKGAAHEAAPAHRPGPQVQGSYDPRYEEYSYDTNPGYAPQRARGPRPGAPPPPGTRGPPARRPRPPSY